MLKISYTIFGLFLILNLLPLSQYPITAISDIEDKSSQLNQSDILDFRGVNYGHYRDTGPGTGEDVPLSYIEEDLQIMQDLGVTDLRTYRLSDGLSNLPILSLEYGITTAVVTWIGPQVSDIYGGIDEALSFENYTSMTILGNEPLLRGEYTPSEYQEFINYANEQKSADSKIALAEPYYIYLNSPSLVENVTTLMVHVYPAWEGKTIDEAANYTIEKFLEVREMFPDKELYLGEFGWPSGPDEQFNEMNQKRYFDEVLPLIKENNIKPYIFQIFDESWKSEEFNGLQIGPHWGILDEFRQGKPSSETVAMWFGGETQERLDNLPLIIGPEVIDTSLGFDSNIQWIIIDSESVSGTFTLYRNDVLLGPRDLTWQNNTPIDIAVDTSNAGEFEYKIEVKDNQNTVTDIVAVTVKDPNATTSTQGVISSSFVLSATLIGLVIMQVKRKNVQT